MKKSKVPKVDLDFEATVIRKVSGKPVSDGVERDIRLHLRLSREQAEIIEPSQARLKAIIDSNVDKETVRQAIEEERRIVQGALTWRQKLGIYCQLMRAVLTTKRN
ncbi:MAG: hypothetical protein JSS72_12500 [Armatimonadetes bacterium]|nr:hypothetical protein [Armatimonadota bacterium]